MKSSERNIGGFLPRSGATLIQDRLRDKGDDALRSRALSSPDGRAMIACRSEGPE